MLSNSTNNQEDDLQVIQPKIPSNRIRCESWREDQFKDKNGNQKIRFSKEIWVAYDENGKKIPIDKSVPKYACWTFLPVSEL